MSLAISTILLFLLVTPGLAFKYAYFGGKYSRRSVFLPITDEVVVALLPAILLNAIGLVAAYAFSSLLGFFWESGGLFTKPNMRLLTSLLGMREGIEFPIPIVAVIWLFIFYLTAISLAGGYIARRCRRWVESSEKWSDIPFIAPNNDWLEALPDQQTRGNSLAPVKEWAFLQVDAMVETGQGPMIYQGILSELYFKKDGSLDRIVLSGTRRRSMDKDPDETTAQKKKDGTDDRFYDIPGSYVVLDYQRIVNLNVSYGQMQDKAPPLSESGKALLKPPFFGWRSIS